MKKYNDAHEFGDAMHDDLSTKLGFRAQWSDCIKYMMMKTSGKSEAEINFFIEQLAEARIKDK